METIKSLNFIEEVEKETSVKNVVGELSRHIADLQLSASESAFYKEEHAKLSKMYSALKEDTAELQRSIQNKNNEAKELQSKLQSSLEILAGYESEFQSLKKSASVSTEELQAAKKLVSQKEEDIIAIKANLDSIEESLNEDIASWKAQSLDLSAKLRKQEKESQNEISKLQAALDSLARLQFKLEGENADLKNKVKALLSSADETKNLSEKILNLQALKSQIELMFEKTKAENQNLMKEVLEARSQITFLQAKSKVLKSVRLKMKSFYKATIRNLQNENSELKTEMAELQSQLKSQSVTTQKIHIESREIISKTFQSYEEKMSGLKESYEHQIEEMQKKFDHDLGNLNIRLAELMSERSSSSENHKNEVTALSQEFQKRIGTLLEQQEQLRKCHSDELSQIKFQYDEKLNKQQMQIIDSQERLEHVTQEMQTKLKALKTELSNERYSGEILKKQLEEKVIYVAGQGSQFDSLLKEHNTLLAKYETETFEYSKVNEELRRKNLEKSEEIKALKNQLQEKSRQMVRLELAVEELKNLKAEDSSTNG